MTSEYDICTPVVTWKQAAVFQSRSAVTMFQAQQLLQQQQQQQLHEAQQSIKNDNTKDLSLRLLRQL
jgi:hypothetical protein